MGVNGPLHFGGSPRWVAHAERPKTASVKIHPDSQRSPSRRWREMWDERMGKSSGDHLRAARDLRSWSVRCTYQLRLMRSGLILRQAAFTARPRKYSLDLEALALSVFIIRGDSLRWLGFDVVDSNDVSDWIDTTHVRVADVTAFGLGLMCGPALLAHE